jgi:flagellar biosynthesis GTPase FlhF
MIQSKILLSAILGCAVLVACDDKTETPAGSKATTPQASEAASDATQKKAEDASERAKDAAGNASSAAKDQAEAASDALKKNADAAASSVATQPSADADAGKIQQALDYIRDKKWDLAESTVKELEGRKASLPASLQGQVDNTRKLLDAAKTGLGAVPSIPAAPK